MFGVVPKLLWQRVYPADQDNLIRQTTNCLVVDSHEQRILIETGYGPRLPEKLRQQLHSEPGDPLATSLAAVGVEPATITLVLLTHLHFDHAGGLWTTSDHGDRQLAFPRARILVQRREWQDAVSDTPELRGMYPVEELMALEATGQLELLDGKGMIAPGIQVLPTPGHTAGHQSILLDGGEQRAVFLGDLCPTSRHLRTAWCMAYDVRLRQTRRHKPRLLGRAADNDWWVFFGHDPDCRAAKIARDERREFVIR